jgi:hypothetical protein
MSHFDSFIAERGDIINIPITGNASATIVAGTAGFKIRVMGIVLTITTATTLNLEDTTAGTPVELVGPMPAADNGGFVLPFNPYGWGETAAGKGLVLTLGSGSVYGGVLCYQKVPTT